MIRTSNALFSLAAPAALAVLAALSGCSPALNWRSVPAGPAGLTFSLPCKPDQAQREVAMVGTPVQLSMWGCEADGATFALSHVVLGDAAQVGAALTQWRAAALTSWGPGAAGSAVDAPFAPAGALPLPESVRSATQAQRTDGSTVPVQGVWFARVLGPQLHMYHAVVLDPKGRADVAEQFFAGLVAP